MVTTLEAPYLKDAPVAEPERKPITRDDVLRLIPQFELPCIFKRHHLDREVIIGIIGLRGDGKSASGAVISMLDYMFEGLPVWSNMDIGCRLEIDDPTARRYGMKRGGLVEYRSERLDKQAFLQFDPHYRNGCFYIDEINMEFAEARRAMSNTNLYMDKVGQQLRKLKASLIYTVINEMFIDSRIRELTDIFIKAEDTALSVAGLENKKPTGLDFKWNIYPMSGYLLGRENSYYVTHKPMEPKYLKFEKFRGIYDTTQMQGAGVGKYGVTFDKKDMRITELSMEQSPVVAKAVDEWGWLESVANEMYASQRDIIPTKEIYTLPIVKAHGVSKGKLSEMLNAMFNITTADKWYHKVRQKCYIMGTESVFKGEE